MKEKDPSTPTEPQLNDEAKKQKSEAILNALLIGFLIGIIIWSRRRKYGWIFNLNPALPDLQINQET